MRETRRGRAGDSLKQSGAAPCKPPFRRTANWTFTLACQSPVLKASVPSLFPDAQSQVFPLTKRMEFFKLKSLIRNKVFPSLHCGFVSSASPSCTIYNGGIYHQGCHSRTLQPLVVSKRGLWRETDVRSCTVVSTLCKCFSLMP